MFRTFVLKEFEGIYWIFKMDHCDKSICWKLIEAIPVLGREKANERLNLDVLF
jgi:hypothetical protein